MNMNKEQYLELTKLRIQSIDSLLSFIAKFRDVMIGEGKVDSFKLTSGLGRRVVRAFSQSNIETEVSVRYEMDNNSKRNGFAKLFFEAPLLCISFPIPTSGKLHKDVSFYNVADILESQVSVLRNIKKQYAQCYANFDDFNERIEQTLQSIEDCKSYVPNVFCPTFNIRIK